MNKKSSPRREIHFTCSDYDVIAVSEHHYGVLVLIAPLK
jgi:hypothetical protein